MPDLIKDCRLGYSVKRRAFITLLGGAATAWLLVMCARNVQRIGFLTILAKGDREAQVRTAAFQQALAALGWLEGRNIRIDYRYADGDIVRIRAYAAELVKLAPEVIVAVNSPPNRICCCERSARSGFRRELGASWRQHHRVHLYRVPCGGKMGEDA
jgi:hypothetical protein